MKLFSLFVQEIAIDLGTANTLIIQDGQIVIDQPYIIAIEHIKLHVGSALKHLDNAPPDFAVNGRDLITGIPRQITINYAEVAEALDESIITVEEAILRALESTPPELASDIYRTGLYLTGGGALLRGLDKRISRITKLPVHVAEEPLRAVVRGTGIALKNTDRFSFLIDRKRV